MKNEPNGVQLAWGKPMDDGGGKIQGYQVEMKEVGTQNWVPANDAITKDNSFTVDRMKPNTGESSIRLGIMRWFRLIETMVTQE